MPGVNVPDSGDPSGLRTIIPMAGQAIGSIYGGTAGGLAGKKVGEGLVGSASSPGSVDSAVGRRISSIEGDPSVQLARADAALKQMPPEYQQAYGPSIAQARQLDAQGD